MPLTNFLGWFIVGLLAMIGYRVADQRPGILPKLPQTIPVQEILLGCGLYYGVLLFNLGVTFWIGESLMGMAGWLIYIPITVLALRKLCGRLPLSGHT